MLTRPTLTFTSDGRSWSSRLRDVIRDKPAFSVDALAARVLALVPAEPSETPYVGVRCRLVRDAPDRGLLRPRATNAAEAAILLRRALERAVERALEGHRRVAVLTGGGLDSGGLLSVAVDRARVCGVEVFAVALDYEAPGDDRPYLRELEQRLSCEIVRVPPEEGAHHLGLMDGVDGAPFCWPSGPFEAAMLKHARARGADCVLTGAGGDELFDGEPQAVAGIARRGEVARAVRMARNMRGFDAPRFPVAEWVARPVVASVAPVELRLWLARRTRPWIPEWAGPALIDYLRRIHERDLAALEHRLAHRIAVDPSWGDRVRVNIAWLRHMLEVAADVERRDPFEDPDLVQTVEDMRREWLVEGGIRRGLFRIALFDLLPAGLREREDKAVFEPAYVRMLNAAGGLKELEPLASATELARLGLVDAARFREAFDEFCRAPLQGEPWGSLWPALCVERFLRASRSRSVES